MTCPAALTEDYDGSGVSAGPDVVGGTWCPVQLPWETKSVIFGCQHDMPLERLQLVRSLTCPETRPDRDLARLRLDIAAAHGSLPLGCHARKTHPGLEDRRPR